MKWSNYKWRFLPSLAHKLARTTRATDFAPSSSKSVNIDLIKTDLLGLFTCMESQSSSGQAACFETLGFSLTRRRSIIPNGGLGVFVNKGKIGKGRLAAIYPGTIYNPGDSALLVSLGNQFMFRCADYVTIDGNDRALSKSIFRLIRILCTCFCCNTLAQCMVGCCRFRIFTSKHFLKDKQNKV